MKKILYILCMSFIVVMFIGCSQETKNNDKIKVAVSIVPQKTFVEAVGGDLVETIEMIPPGMSPENYAPSPKELKMLSESSVYFSIGVPAEKENILPKLKDINKDIQLISLEDEVSKVYKDREFAPNKRDPHIWLSPKRAVVMIAVIKDELIKIDPKNKQIYEDNANQYIKELKEIDVKIKKSIEKLPKKSFIVYHPAFGYFADDYGLDMISIEEEGKEATIEDIKRVIDFAKSENIKVIFYQAEIDSRQSRTIAEEIGGQTKEIEPLAKEYIKNLKDMAKTFTEVLK
ncbi:metal ABC transporter solute-binding protein, Zn/Mn family [Inediibacterium massiliense]|uniref:metal ABC transporter solute-binding protein, Zn/Mn family n=1 Tax=Inediibacterium massiliense TaxID=1658111 RepID=UPI0006B62379|nr:zinc ABC transporter substrate-binding protein [Inediibacterium massiliense]